MKNKNILLENGVNVDNALNFLGDMETYDETIETFMGEVNEKLEKMTKALREGDMANYAILVHSLKSDSKYLGFDKLAELSYNHELKSKANDIDYCINNYKELMDEASRIINVVTRYMGDSLKPSEEEFTIVYDEDTNNNEEQVKTLLVVDDSNIITHFISKVFEDKFNVAVATNGNEALNVLKNVNPKDIAGMFLDINMPNVNGFGVLDYMKRNNLFGDVEVALITGEDVIDERLKDYPLVGILRKPFSEEDLKNMIAKMK